MTIGERIRELRKKHLTEHYPEQYPKPPTQEKFGELLFRSRSYIFLAERNAVKLEDSFINLICNIFNVNKNWLTNGAGNVFNETDDIELLTKIYRQLNTKNQDEVLKHVLSLFLDEKKAQL